MKNQVKRIIICGGGSAGWMSAAWLSTLHPDKEIALIESPNIPVIGVGESTLGTINTFLRVMGLEDKDWMPECDATYKLGIKFSDFYDKNDVYYYPFGIKDQQNTKTGVADWYIKKTLFPETSKLDFYDSFYSCMPFIYQNKIYDNKDNQLPNFSFGADVAYHVDAIKFGQMLKNKIAIPNGVVHIVDTITEVKINSYGEISSLMLKNGDELEADLYLDCTGFKSLLMKHFMLTWESFSDQLPNEKAWVCHVPYTDKELEMENVTNCTGWNNGWCWNIPLYDRIGAGYVYSPQDLPDNDALEEFKKYLDSDRMKHYNPNRSAEITEFKQIEIKNGCYGKCWVENCVGVGLSFGFIEPLESTGLLTVQEILLRLSETLHLPIINRIHQDHFNYVVKNIMYGFRDFVAYHFLLSARRDTEYWRQMTEWTRLDPRMEDPTRCDSLNSMPAVMANNMLQQHHLSGDISMGGTPDIFVGNNYIPVNTTQYKVLQSLVVDREGQFEDIYTTTIQDYWDQKHEYITQLAEQSDSHYTYLNKNIYQKSIENTEVIDNTLSIDSNVAAE